jgi:hypothetical protein
LAQSWDGLCRQNCSPLAIDPSLFVFFLQIFRVGHALLISYC